MGEEGQRHARLKGRKREMEWRRIGGEGDVEVNKGRRGWDWEGKQGEEYGRRGGRRRRRKEQVRHVEKLIKRRGSNDHSLTGEKKKEKKKSPSS